jgi:peptide deformylase
LPLPVLKYPAPGLKRKSRPVDKIGEEIFRLVDEMIEAMMNDEGVGLAANQVGSEARIFVMNTTPSEEQVKSMVFINPVVLNQEGEIVDEEGCLSFPDLYLNIARPQKVRVYAKDLYNEGFVIDLAGMLARAAMHEMDHLNGILFIERAAATEREKIEKYVEEINKKVQNGCKK